jgi:hypothetical protein
LGDFFGLGVITHNPASHAKDRPGKVTVEKLERELVTPTDPDQQFLWSRARNRHAVGEVMLGGWSWFGHEGTSGFGST